MEGIRYNRSIHFHPCHLSMFTKRLSFLASLLVALGCAFCTACSSGASQSETVGNDSTAAAKPAPSLQDGKGTARLIPNAPIVVNTHGTWKIVFTVGSRRYQCRWRYSGAHFPLLGLDATRRIEIKTTRDTRLFPLPTKRPYSIR